MASIDLARDYEKTPFRFCHVTTTTLLCAFCPSRRLSDDRVKRYRDGRHAQIKADENSWAIARIHREYQETKSPRPTLRLTDSAEPSLGPILCYGPRRSSPGLTRGSPIVRNGLTRSDRYTGRCSVASRCCIRTPLVTTKLMWRSKFPSDWSFQREI